MKLLIANKNHSSWSLRPWILLKQFGIPFEEVLIPFGPTFDDPVWKKAISVYTPAGQVPALLDGETKVWASIAIIEHVADTRPDRAIWPREQPARAFARAIAAEMHAGFSALRNACPMNLAWRHAARDRGPAVAADVARITDIWTEARARFGVGGPFLFGAFTAADAMFAPVTTRFTTYALPTTPVTQAYIEAVQGTEAFRSWEIAAFAEPWILPEDEMDEPVLKDFRPHLRRANKVS